MADISQRWKDLLEPRNHFLEQELLQSGGVGLIAGRGEYGQKIFGLQKLSLRIPFDSMASFCNS
jgi:hypothetical protein